jgi:UDP-2,4-diacetamido-2,4,6-trideoxy-beta-L-altropyranose hydrolase
MSISRKVGANGLPEPQLIVREAQSEDSLDVLRWRNDPLVCAMSRETLPIGRPIHDVWYARAMEDPNRLLLIGVRNGQKIGIVRFDYREASLWEVSIMLASEARGRGNGASLLQVALECLRSANAPIRILATIRFSNQPSLRLFDAFGFKRESDDGEFINLILIPD